MSLIHMLFLAGLVSMSCVWLTRMSSSPLKFYYKNILMLQKVPLSAMISLPVTLQPFWNILPFASTEIQGQLEPIGLIVYFCGVAFGIWGRLSMDKNWGVPAQHTIEKQKDLVTHGAFKYSRNPIYVGILLMFLGLELALGSCLILLVVPFYLYIRGLILKEEVLLKKHFGKQWDHYKGRVRRFL